MNRTTFVIQHPDLKDCKLFDVEVPTNGLTVGTAVVVRVADKVYPMRVLSSVIVLEFHDQDVTSGTFSYEVTLVRWDYAGVGERPEIKAAPRHRKRK